MQKKISPIEYESLMSFTRQHFVEYYDLQSELADHLANGIEQQWAHNPQIDFTTALQAEFKKFGIFGFSDVVEQRSKALSKRYYRLLWSYFKQFFGLPLIIGSVAAVAGIRVLLALNEWVFPVLLFMVIAVSIVRVTRIRKKYNAKVKAGGRKWLLEDIIYGCGGVGVLMNVPLQLYINIKTVPSGTILWVLSFVIVLISIYDYIVLWKIPSQAEEHLQRTYPEYKLV